MNIPPTRQELLILKQKIKVAKRSIKLLKDKRNALTREFLKVISEATKARGEFDELYQKTYENYKKADSLVGGGYLKTISENSESELRLKTTKKSIMSVDLTEIDVDTLNVDVNYSKLATNVFFDLAIEDLEKSLPSLVVMLEKEHSARVLSEEIIKTRKRVNSLEHIVLPQMKKTIKNIESKLAELAQSMNIMLMRVKSNIN